MSDSEFVYKPQDVNYLGFLEAQLRDMAGVDALAFELIQNADDVHNEDGRFPVTTLSFDVTDDALIVHNNGRFRPVDFERLQNIAGGGKRQEAGVTGAFGLGFLAVYQITDAPEILSSGRHWIIRPDAPADQRIAERAAETSGTTFRLPWALDPASPIRRSLRLEAVNPVQLDTFAEQIGEAIARAAFFLQRLQRLTVSRNGVVVSSIERQLEGDRLLLTDEAGDSSEWLLFNGSFTVVAAELRQQYPWQIEDQRRSRVQIALPKTGRLRAGRLYAGLPTADTVLLAFHLNADFFPTTDRKRVHFDDGYQSAWNQAAIRAAAALLADKLPQLPARLSPTGLWHLLQNSADAAQRAQRRELPAIFAAFWEALLPRLRQTPVFYTAADAWLPPNAGRLLPEGTAVVAEATLPVLNALDIPVLHPALTAYAPLLRQIGAPTLAASDVADGLRRAGLTRTVSLSEAPPFLRTLADWQPLWGLLDGLLRGLPPAAQAQSLADLDSCALALTERMALRPLTQVYRSQPDARMLFPDVAWLHPALATDTFPGRVAPTFGVRQAVTRLAEMPPDQLHAAWRLGRLDVVGLFRWFERQQIEIFADDPTLAAAIRRLPLCPVNGELRPLADLYLPGGFADPLQLAGLVDVAAIGGREHFLRDLGVAALDFDTYLHTHLPRVLAQQPDLPADRRHRLLHLLANRLGEFRDDATLQAQLAQLPLIPCLDGAFRAAPSLYFSRQVRDRLGLRAHIAEPVESTAQQALYAWLGVRTAPAAADVIQALLAAGEEWKDAPLAAAVYDQVINCWQALADGLQSGEFSAAALAPLHRQPVIPNEQRVLIAPDELLVADRPQLAAQFAAWADRLLPADAAWAPAAIAAGARPLSQAVTVGVVDGHEAVPNTAVLAHIQTRIPLLERLLRAEADAGHPVQTKALQAALQAMQVMNLPNLHIQLQLRIGDALIAAAAEPAAAKWIDGVLYLDSTQQPAPWTAVARELARVVIPGQTVGGLAFGIKEVLAAPSVAAATAVLDEMGYS